jgi:hypothetical protein
MTNVPGYFAVSRGIFEHPLLQSSKAFSAREALLWLISAAAWKPKGRRNKFGTIHNKRGQISVTRRELAREWNWSKSRVDRFLVKLAADSTIILATAFNGPEIGPQTEPIIGYPRTMITLCNYDKFQSVPRSARTDAGQKSGQKSGQYGPTLPGFDDGAEPQPVNPSTKVRKVRPSECPGDGARNSRVVFARVGSELWAMYARDYRDFTGTEPLPQRYADGNSGRWFKRNGEAKIA